MKYRFLCYFEDVSDGSVDSYDTPWEAVQKYSEEMMQPKVFLCGQVTSAACPSNQPQQTEETGYEISVVE